MKNSWQNPSFIRRSLRITLPILIAVLLCVAAFSCWSIYQLVNTIHYQNHSLAVQAKLNNLTGLLQDAETAGEANLLLGDDDFRTEYAMNIERIPQRMRELKLLIHNDPRQVETFNQVEGIVLETVHRLSEQLVQHPVDPRALIEALHSYRKNLILGHLIQKGFQEMDLRESIDLNNHERNVKLYSESAIQLIAVGTVLIVALLLLFAYLSYAEIQRRNRLLEDLGQAREAATVASKLKSQFLATVSHEIRTPLNGIIGFSDLLKNRMRDPEQKNMVALIHQSGLNLLKIVNDILDFSKVEAGKVDFEISDFSLLQVLGSVVELLSLKARQKGLTIVFYVDGRLPQTLRGDSSRISQIMQNLVNNALKFTDRGGVFIKVSERGRSDQGESIIRLEVQDTGVGISAEGKALLFQPFNQLNRSEGTGLGLSICKSLVEQMGGSIGVDSVLGQGSTFWFEVPFPRSSHLQISEHKPVALQSSGRKIKVVSKSLPLRKALGCFFAEWGLSADFVEDSSGMLGENSFLIFDALKWHPKDVHEKAGHFRNQPKLFMVSDWNDSHEASDIRENVLKAPFTREQLLAALDRAFEARPEPVIKRADPDTSRPLQLGARAGLILLAEDNPVNQALAEMHVERLGFKVHSVANGREVLDAIGNIEYNLILMDVQMPVMDGFEATRKIRDLEMKTGRHVPIVAMTANAITGDREKCLAAGMDDYIAKPFREEELSRILTQFIDSEPPELIDWAVLRELSGKTSATTVRKLIESFITTLSRSLKKFEESVAANDVTQIRFLAHQLKASSQSLGAMTLANMCAEIEANVDAGAEVELVLSQARALVDQGHMVLSGFEDRNFFTGSA